jgi:hypothetical protein
MIEPAAAAPAPEPAVAPEPAAAPAPEEASGAGSLPDELLKLPVMQALIAGKPAAVSATLKEFEKRPEAKMFVKNKENLLKAGFGLYRSLGGDLGVVFNQMHVHGDELKAADQAGQLIQIAPSFDTVNEAVSKSGAANPVLHPDVQVPPAMKTAPVPPVPQMAATPAPAATNRKLMQARVTNLQPGAPTSGPSPGAGRLLNSILKPVL